MHDQDRTDGRTTLEAYEPERDGELGEFQAKDLAAYRYAGYQGEGEGDYESEYEADYEGDYEGEYEDESTYASEAAEGALLSEDEVNELADELLSITNPQELDQFLGNIVRSFVRSPLAHKLGGMLKNVAAQAVPLVAQALGGAIGAPGGAGADHGASADEFFGMETEGLSDEDADFEVAKQFVRFAVDTAHEAAQVPPGVSSSDAASHAVTAAAQRHAPGLLMPAPDRRQRSGRWVRHGDTVIVQGI